MLASVTASRDEWTRPGAFEVAPGVFRIPLPMPSDGLRAVNVYAIEDGRGLTLIDGGWAVEPARRDLELALKQLGATPRSITRILVTHSHRDHYTMAVALRRDFGTPIALGVGERRSLEAAIDRIFNFGPQMSALRESGAPALAAAIEAEDVRVDPAEGWELPDEWLEAGEMDIGNRQLQILATPGHTQGHVVFADLERQLLFAGDHVLPHITPSIGLEAFPGESPLKDFLGSLAKVRALPDMKLFGAHGPAAGSTHARIEELVAHHDGRIAEMRAVVVAAGSQRSVTAADVAAGVGWTRHKRALVDMDRFNQMLAILETRSHLRLLVGTGALVSRVDPSGVVLYQAPAVSPA